jgi:hypothetical protein
MRDHHLLLLLLQCQRLGSRAGLQPLPTPVPRPLVRSRRCSSGCECGVKAAHGLRASHLMLLLLLLLLLRLS